MKKRLLLILAVGISFSPSVFALEYNKATVGEQIHCAVLDGDKGEVPDSDNIQSSQPKKVSGSITQAGSTISSNIPGLN